MNVLSLLRRASLFGSAARNHRAVVCLIASACLLASGCKREQVSEYQVPKEQSTMPAQAAQNLPAGHPATDAGGMAMPPMPKLKWSKLPDGWTEKAPSAMRVASFDIPGKDGQRAEVGVIPLPAGGDELNLVNMWREQMKLPNVAAADADKQSENVTIGADQGKLFEMVSEAPLIPATQDGQPKWKARIMVAMVTRDGTSWFFKLTGVDEWVTAQKSSFLEFLKGVSYGPADAPQAAMIPNNAEEGPPVAQATPGLPKWTAPEGWQSQTPGQMVLASFKAGEATVNVSAFPGDVGGMLANVNRWRQQVGQEPIAADDLDKNLTALDGDAKLVDVAGTDSGTEGAKRLVGAIVPHAGQTWFYKMTGTEQAVAAQKDAFVHFVMNVRYPDAP